MQRRRDLTGPSIMRTLMMIVLALGCSGGGGSGAGPYGTPPGSGNPMPSGISAGQACKPEQCGARPAAQTCPNGQQPTELACLTDISDRCHWQGGQCPSPDASVP